jgi:hypothetical protein
MMELRFPPTTRPTTPDLVTLTAARVGKPVFCCVLVTVVDLTTKGQLSKMFKNITSTNFQP